MLMHPFQFGSLNLHNNQLFFFFGIWVENVSFCWCKIGHYTNAQQQKKQRTEEDPWSHRMELKMRTMVTWIMLILVFFFFFFFMLKKSFIFLFFKRNYKFHSLTLSIFILKKKKKNFVSVGTETINFIDKEFYSLQFVC